MSAYYNEHDPFAASWLKELIADQLIPPGDVDERSIEDVRPKDLGGYAQCHFFAGIGVWPLALRLAGIPDSAPLWTGSCPCQPFSAAGKGAGFADERHLWPAFYHLISVKRPRIVLGEQVASKDGLAWLDLVQADLENADYACGAVDTCAAGFGAPHIRQRLYWLAHAGWAGLEGRNTRTLGNERATVERSGGFDGVEQPSRIRRQWREAATPGNNHDWATSNWSQSEYGASEPVSSRLQTPNPGPVNGLWRDADWLYCRDGKWRPVAAGTFPLADAGAVRNRVGKLRGSGNALNLAQAQGFIEAARDFIV